MAIYSLRIVAAGVALSALTPLLASAATEPKASCNLSQETAALTEAISGSANEQTTLVRELAARKVLLTRALSCAKEEVRSVTQDLLAVKIDESETRILRFRDVLRDGLAATERFYASQEPRIKDLGLWGSKVMAREVREWRLTNFAVTKDAVASFILWHNHQELLSAADARLAQIKDTVRILKLQEEEKVVELLAHVEGSLADARDGYDMLTKAFTAQAIPEKPLETVKASLDALGETYRSFFELSEAVKTLLPRP